MGDHGAEVIKIEPPKVGDAMRSWGQGIPLWFSVVGRNKKSITLNLREREGQDIVKRLVEKSDFLLENFRAGTLEKWGLGYDALSAINRALIMIRVSGYGQTGPYAKRAGYGGIGEAMGGMRYIMGESDRLPSRAGLSIGDSLAATYALPRRIDGITAPTQYGRRSDRRFCHLRGGIGKYGIDRRRIHGRWSYP